METEGTYEVATVATSTALDLRKSSELDLSVLKEFLSSWRQGGETVTTFSATGIQWIAQEMGITVENSSFVETSSGEGYYFTATARNMQTGQSYVAHVYQSRKMKRGGKEVFDPDAIAKGSTRVARNAMQGLIPVQILKHRVLDAIKKGEVEASQIVGAQSEARRMLGKQRASLQSQFGITPAEAFDKGQEMLGSSEHWDAETWARFTQAVESLDAEWFGGGSESDSR